MRQGALTLADANAQIAQLQQQLIDKDLELSIYLQVAASFQEKDNNRAAAAGNSSSNSALEREVRELRERVRVLSSTGNAVSSSTALVPASPWAMVPMIPPPRRQTPLQGALAEINYAFDLLDARGDGVISRWDLLKGMMDVPEVRGLLRLGGSADQAELNELIGEMSGEGQNTVGRHEFEHFFTRREIERAGGGGSGGGSDASTKDKPGAAAKGGKGAGTQSAGKGGGAGKDTGGATASAKSASSMRSKAPSQYTLPTGFTVPGYNAPGAGSGGMMSMMGLASPGGAYMPGYSYPTGPYAHPAYSSHPSGVPYSSPYPNHAGGYGGGFYGACYGGGHPAIGAGGVTARSGGGTTGAASPTLSPSGTAAGPGLAAAAALKSGST